MKSSLALLSSLIFRRANKWRTHIFRYFLRLTQLNEIRSDKYNKALMQALTYPIISLFIVLKFENQLTAKRTLSISSLSNATYIMNMENVVLLRKRTSISSIHCFLTRNRFIYFLTLSSTSIMARTSK